MAQFVKALTSRSPRHAAWFNVMLPSHHSRGIYHGSVSLGASVQGDTLIVHLAVTGENKRVHDTTLTFTAEQLGVSSTPRREP